jgi:hypothetical protein
MPEGNSNPNDLEEDPFGVEEEEEMDAKDSAESSEAPQPGTSSETANSEGSASS